ncbi:MAG TPA: glycosyltransferase family 39 protein [Bryobacteraceae bacterium]|nr:glycosyltransferase family 39 protein [Bryobacteraceae bacterium]
MSRSWLIFPLLLLYLLHLGGVGFLGPDEPRYASIGREMARSGDGITPRLDGQPWFEKPPLTYWLTAAGHLAGLPDEWAARLPQALISAAFLVFFYFTLAREFSAWMAMAATAMLATSGGWMAYSFAALTDLPMSAALGAAMLILLFDPRRAVLAGALLGLSILAKGFVPVVLIAPLFLVARGKRMVTLASAVTVAAPWFVLCWLRNGSAFWNDFFWKQHVARFLTPSLEHVQPFWYYIPVLLAGLFPWTPLAALLARRGLYSDRRVLLLAAWALYGLIFFSVARNKLPGYLLPLFPALAIVLAAGLETAPVKAWWLAACALLLVGLPTVAGILPDALLAGLSRSHVAFALGGLVFMAAAASVWWLAWKQQTEAALLSVALAAGIGAVYLKYSTFPALDRTVSVRSFWRTHQSEVSDGCVDGVSRTWQYGLNYYAGHEIPECAGVDAADAARRPRITTRDRQLAMEDASVHKVVQ